MRHIYILQCADDTLYTGITTDLERRVEEHNSSALGAKYTKARRPVRLVWSQETENRSQASKIELMIKKKDKSQKTILIKNKTKIEIENTKTG